VTGCDSPETLVLTLGATSLDLMDPANGFLIANVDLGFPAVREVETNRPAADGTIDETGFAGPRVVTISGHVMAQPGASRSTLLAALAPFLDPAARPTLVYAIDADQPARQLTLRVSAFTSPYSDPTVSAFQAAWKSADPWATSAAADTVAVAGGASNIGRSYPLRFPRTYPAGAAPTATAVNGGNRPTRPQFRVDGPITGPIIYGGGVISFLPSFSVPVGRYLTVDCATRSVLLDGRYNSFGQIDFLNTIWPIFLPGVQNTILLQGAAIGPTTLLTCTWRDAWYF
jgi:hypothetical protein